MANTSFRLSLSLFFVLLGGSLARAEYMDWSYHWSIKPSMVLTSGTGSVAQALGAGAGAQRILVGAVTTTSEAMNRDPDVYNKNFNLTLRLKDLATGQSGSLTFSGNIRGTLSYYTAHLIESFRTPLEHLRLGNHIYWVKLPSQLRLMPPGSPVVPTFDASVYVENVPPFHHPITRASLTTASIRNGSNGAASTPEPSGLVLGSLGAVFLSCVVARRTWG